MYVCVDLFVIRFFWSKTNQELPNEKNTIIYFEIFLEVYLTFLDV